MRAWPCWPSRAPGSASICAQLPQYQQQGQLFSVRHLVHLVEYPDPRFLGPFYAQSVSLVELLAKAKGPHTLTQFLRDGLRDGYEPALQRHYGWDFKELERRWRLHVFNTAS